MRGGRDEEGGGINLGLILIKPLTDFNLFFFEARFLRAYLHVCMYVCTCTHVCTRRETFHVTYIYVRRTALSMLRVTFTRGKSAHGCGAIQYIFFIHFTLVITK